MFIKRNRTNCRITPFMFQRDCPRWQFTVHVPDKRLAELANYSLCSGKEIGRVGKLQFMYVPEKRLDELAIAHSSLF